MAFETTLSIGVDTRKARSDLARLDQSLKKTGDQGARSTKKLTGSFERLKKSVFNLRNATVALALAALIKGIIKVGSQFEQLRIQLKTVTGSVLEAGKAFDRIKRLAVETPFQVENITTAFIRLKAIGIEPTNELLIAFGDVAAGLGRDITDFTRAAVGAAFGETEALKSFGIAAKVVGDQISFTFKGVTTTVDREVNAVIGALQKIGEENFTGAAQDQVDSFKGAMSNLGDSVAALLDELARTGILTTFSNAIRAVADAVTYTREQVERLKAAFQEPKTLDALREEEAALLRQYKLIEKIRTENVQEDIGFDPFGFGGIMGQTNEEEFERIKQALREVRKRMAALQGPGPTLTVTPDSKLENFIKKTNEGLSEQNRLLKTRVENFGLMGPQLDAIIEKEKLRQEIEKGNIKIGEVERRELERAIDANADLATQLEALEKGKSIYDENRTALEKYNDELMELHRLHNLGAISQDTFNKQLEKNTQDLIEADPVLSTVHDGLGDFSDAMVDAAVSGENFGETMKRVFREMAADILKSLNRILINKAFASLIGGTLFGGGGGSTPLASFAGSSAGMDIFGNSGFSPSFAHGGYHGGGMRLVGEQGPELEVTGPSRIYPAEQTARMLSGGGGPSTVIHMDLRGSNGEASIEEAVERGIRRAAPQLVNASVKKVQSERRRDPKFFGAAGVG